MVSGVVVFGVVKYYKSFPTPYNGGCGSCNLYHDVVSVEFVSEFSVEWRFSPGLVLGSCKIGGLQWLEFVVELPCSAWYMRNDGADMWMLCKFDDLQLVVVVVDVVML